jgi:hypothetical protein
VTCITARKKVHKKINIWKLTSLAGFFLLQALQFFLQLKEEKLYTFEQ